MINVGPPVQLGVSQPQIVNVQQGTEVAQGGGSVVPATFVGQAVGQP